MRKKGSKKNPCDYPIISFRVSKPVKDEIIRDISSVARALNKNRDADNFLIRKNDVFVSAIRTGLLNLKKNRGTYES